MLVSLEHFLSFYGNFEQVVLWTELIDCKSSLIYKNNLQSPQYFQRDHKL